MSGNYFATYTQDFDQEPFDAKEFVERLSWRLTSGGGREGRDKEAAIDPKDLQRKLEEEIGNLQMLSETYEGKIRGLRNQCGEEEEALWATLERLAEENAAGFEQAKALDGKIRLVSAKVVHLGSQLEALNGPRSRAAEAFALMSHFNDFNSDQPLSADVFYDPGKLVEAGALIVKLSQVASELDPRTFSAVQNRIAHQYEEVEKLLLEDFAKTYRQGRREHLKDLAQTLHQFKGYSRCTNAFVEMVQVAEFRSNDVFADILSLCKKTEPVLREVFPDPEAVMAKLVLNIFHGKLAEKLKERLEDGAGDRETYLTSLYDLYSKTQRLSRELTDAVKVGSDRDYVPALIRALFAKYVEPYMGTEKKHLREHCQRLLKDYYEREGHQKRQLPAGGMSEMKRDVQARLFNPETFASTFIDEGVAITILQETKGAFQRAQLLSAPGEEAANLEAILDLLIRFLFAEHLEYAVELSLNNIPLGDSRQEPPLSFLTVCRQTAAITHLFEKQFDDSILPLLRSGPVKDGMVGRKRETLARVEGKLSAGLERLLGAVVGHVRALFGEQRKTEFRPEDESAVLPQASTTAKAVGAFLEKVVSAVGTAVDGENWRAVLEELGLRFHRALVEQLYTLTVSSTGGMLLLCDVNEYRRALAPAVRCSPTVGRLLDATHALCNLLVVSPENLRDASEAQLLDGLSKPVLHNFVQLRHDSKSDKLPAFFRST